MIFLGTMLGSLVGYLLGAAGTLVYMRLRERKHEQRNEATRQRIFDILQNPETASAPPVPPIKKVGN